MTEARRAVRERNRALRQCILEILKADWPQPWSTPELRLAFRAQEYAKVYPQLMGLETAKQIRAFHAENRLWWVYIGEGHWPRCSVCNNSADDLVLLDWHDGRRGGWVCALREHRLELIKQDWPWPTGADLLLVRDQ